MNGERGAGGVGRKLAMVCWIVPVACMLGTGGVYGLHSTVGAVLWGMFCGLALLVSVGLGIGALTRIGVEGRPGILLPALAGLALDGLLVVGAIAGLAVQQGRAELTRLENQKRVTAGSTTDATATIVDPDYRFRLGWPGKGWKLLSAREAARLTPNAIAGAMHENGSFGLVIVEPNQGADLEAYAGRVVASVGGTTPKASPFEALTFHGHPALRFTVDTQLAAGPRRFEMVAFLREGFGFRVAVSTKPARAELAREFIDAFAAEPGEIKPRAAAPERGATSGVGWRMKGTEFQSAVHRVAVEPRGGFRVVTGSSLEVLDKLAEVGLVSDALGVSLSIQVERAAGVDQGAFTRKVMADAAAALEVKPPFDVVPAVIGGRAIELRRFPPGKQPAYEHLIGVHFEDGRSFRVEAWYELARREQGAAAAVEAVGSVRFLDPAEAEAVALKIGDGRASEARVGATHALRGGVYRDFGRGFVWTEPKGAWRVRVGQDAASYDAAAVIYLQEPALGITGGLYAEPTTEDQEAHHRAHAKRLLGRFAPAEPTKVMWGEVPALLSGASYRIAGVDLRTEVSSAVVGGQGYRFTFWGSLGNMEAAAPALEAVRAGLAFPKKGVVASETVGATYVDHRFGFSFEPPSGWTFSDNTPADERGIATELKWTDGLRSVEFVAVGIGGSTANASFLTDILEQRMRDLAPDATPEPGKLAGRPCRRLRGSSGLNALDIRLLEGTESIYNVIVRAPGDGSEAIAAGFRLTE